MLDSEGGLFEQWPAVVLALESLPTAGRPAELEHLYKTRECAHDI